MELHVAGWAQPLPAIVNPDHKAGGPGTSSTHNYMAELLGLGWLGFFLWKGRFFKMGMKLFHLYQKQNDVTADCLLETEVRVLLGADELALTG